MPQTGTAETPAHAVHQTSFYVILNGRAGGAHGQGVTREQLRDAFEKRGCAAVVDACEAEFGRAIERALASDARVIVAAGGDGTATIIADRLVGTDKVLAVLPLGTANLLARDLGMPMTLDGAIEVLATTAVRRIDVGEVNGHVFLHKVVVGMFPAMAAVREKVRGEAGLGSLVSFLRYLVRRLSRGRRMAVAIASRDTEERIERVRAIAVANNTYDEGWAKVFRRSRLDAGCLTLYALKALGVGDVVRLLVKMMIGRWRDDEAVTIDTVGSVTLDAKRPTLRVMIDGEVELLETPLRFTIRPAALRVLAPAVVEAEAG